MKAYIDYDESYLIYTASDSGSGREVAVDPERYESWRRAWDEFDAAQSDMAAAIREADEQGLNRTVVRS